MKFSWRLVFLQSALVLLVAWGVSLRTGSGLASLWSDPLLLVLLPVCIAASSAVLLYGVGASLRAVGEKLRRADEETDPFLISLPEYADLELSLTEVIAKNRERRNHLQTEKSRLEVIIESITEGILVTGRDGRVVLANGALGRLFGLQVPVQGRPTAEVVRNAAIQDAISYSLQQCAGQTLEVEMPGSLVRHLDVHVAPIRNGSECVGVVTVFYDITRLRQLERMRRDFVANVSHELRTPLTAIKGYAETLADGALEDREAAARFIAIISSHADRLNRLLDDLLDLSRLESDQVKVEKIACNLHGLVEACKASVVGAAQKSISVIIDIAVDVEVCCDPKFIEQALINLLDNAIKYTPDGGEVRVSTRRDSTRRDSTRLWLDVADTGIGIPSADIGRIFERFYRVDKGRSRAMGGTGLGLAIVRHVVEAHGEKVQVQSKLGEGTTFSLSFTSI